jgi:tetratricopeptide (TPR) repeat protein
MGFAHSWLLILVVLLIPFWIWFAKKSVSPAEKRRFPFLVFALAALLVGAAKPYWSKVEEPQLVKGVDLIVILDVSQSMFCEDGTPRRIDQARQFLRAFLPRFNGSSVALIYFAGDAQIGSPFTTDLRAIDLFLNSVTPAMTGVPGTLTAPLTRILQELPGLSEDSKVHRQRNKLALLFSDGEFFDDSGNFQKWLKQQDNFTLLTFLCGTMNAKVPKYDLSGPYPDAYSHATQSTLRSLTTSADNISYNLRTSNPAAIEKELNRKIQYVASKGRLRPDYRHVPFLIAALLFWILYEFLPLFEYLSFKYPRLIPLSISGFFVISLSVAAVSDSPKIFSEAMKEAGKKQYDSAINKLKKLQKEGGATEEVEIALGNLYFIQGKYEEAIKNYQSALVRNPLNPRARWNWEVVLKKMSQPNKSPEAQPPKAAPLPQMPAETSALLNYFDQLEQQQMKENQSRQPNPAVFAW